MIPKKRLIENKNSINNNIISNPGMTKSARLIINTSHINSNSISNKISRNLPKKSNSIDKNIQKTTKIIRNNKNAKSSKLYNMNIQRQNSQGLYSIKNYMNDTQYTQVNHKYHRQNSQILNETKTPRLLELLNNKIKKKRKYLQTYNNNSSNKDNNYNKANASLSSAQRKKNLSQGNMDYINFDEY